MLNNALAILLQALGAVLFFNRFIAGVALRFLKKQAFDEADYGYQPTVTVVVPMYNEGAEIRRTLGSLLELAYPTDKLDIVVIDDCSSDDSFAHASAVAATSGGRLRVLRNKHNLGKRRSINRAVLASRSRDHRLGRLRRRGRARRGPRARGPVRPARHRRGRRLGRRPQQG
ncbi:MAG: glycosyltransferase [Myxococcales bacterium]|nr:glycosyltransferase [Myxococcales bacterium]